MDAAVSSPKVIPFFLVPVCLIVKVRLHYCKIIAKLSEKYLLSLKKIGLRIHENKGQRAKEQELIHKLNVICWEHARSPGSLHGAIHPAVINGLHVDNVVTISEGDLVFILGTVIVHGSVGP